MRMQTDRYAADDAILAEGEGDAALAAWTLEELEDDLGASRPAFAGSDDAGG